MRNISKSFPAAMRAACFAVILLSFQTEADEPVPDFTKSSDGKIRQKRYWVVPGLKVLENGIHLPQKVERIYLKGDKTDNTIKYSITGEGADLPPKGRFTIDRNTGDIYVTKSLDREEKATYKFMVHPEEEGGGNSEPPIKLELVVLDQNDNRPIFNKTEYTAEVAESSPVGKDVIQVSAYDLDDPNTPNGMINYSVVSQDPKEPNDNMFTINPKTGMIKVNRELDRETITDYTLVVRATDGVTGAGFHSDAKVHIKVTDSNDHAPVFTEKSTNASVKENLADEFVVKMVVTDEDEPNTPNSNAKFKIVAGPKDLFTVETGTNKKEGILKTTTGLDFEKSATHTLVIAVENEVPFATSLPTSSATVVVTVEDVNEPPIFDAVAPMSKREDTPLNTVLVQLKARDPDTARKQEVKYKMIKDPQNWLKVDDLGRVMVQNEMDRESDGLQNYTFKPIIVAYDDDVFSATGTVTLTILLEDVNDNAPIVEDKQFSICNKKAPFVNLTVIDKDGPDNGPPFQVSLTPETKPGWIAEMNSNKTVVMVKLANELSPGTYTLTLRIKDKHGLSQNSNITAKVCDCTGEGCKELRAAGFGISMMLIMAAILALLLLAVLVAFRVRKHKNYQDEEKKSLHDELMYYNEEGGGEDDQNFDINILNRGLNNQHEIYRNDVKPTHMPAPQYRTRPANPEDIRNFIDDNLKAADNDPTAPPYDSLLMFDHEGSGSDAGSLSSLNSGSSGDQDYDCLSEWGPRFKKLADMYGGGEDDDML